MERHAAGTADFSSLSFFSFFSLSCLHFFFRLQRQSLPSYATSWLDPTVTRRQKSNAGEKSIDTCHPSIKLSLYIKVFSVAKSKTLSLLTNQTFPFSPLHCEYLLAACTKTLHLPATRRVISTCNRDMKTSHHAQAVAYNEKLPIACRYPKLKRPACHR